MRLFLYDGSWKGFLNLLDRLDALDCDPAVERIQVRRKDLNGQMLLPEGETVLSLEQPARRLHRRIGEDLLPREQWLLRRCQAACSEQVDTLLLSFWLASENLSIEERRSLEECSRRVSFEIHRFYGLLRFFPLEEGVMYAPLQPDYLILPFLMQWAEDRFPDTPLLLHDRGRGLYRWRLQGGSGEGPYRALQRSCSSLPPEDALIRMPGTDDALTAAWRGYTRAVSIDERKNSRQQNSYLPKKYRSYLPEFRE